MRFEGKVALITACASGIGRATADIMAREGAIVVAVDNNAERLEKTVVEIATAGGKAHGRLCNALDATEVDPLVEGSPGNSGASTSWSTRSAAARLSGAPARRSTN
jgi:NAD(P)-dependent dehydrogenase (short-subunit alcohol dehydrogenase family)